MKQGNQGAFLCAGDKNLLTCLEKSIHLENPMRIKNAKIISVSMPTKAANGFWARGRLNWHTLKELISHLQVGFGNVRYISGET